jgi:23S rRNA pseudouridine2605 synthase
MRLAKHLAHAGVASRRAAEKLIAEGRVAVDGEVVTDPARDVGEGDRVEVDGEVVSGSGPRVVYAVNKPLGVVSTARDTHGRPTVVELVPAAGLRLYPVGRLDADSSGLILLTNDGELANRLTHPRYEVSKTYLARVGGGRVGENAVRALRGGVELEDGVTAPARARRVQPNAIELTIHEGRNRQVRRMCEAIGHPVLALQRIAFGPLRLGDLAPGAHRRLSAAEIERVRANRFVARLRSLEVVDAREGELDAVRWRRRTRPSDWCCLIRTLSSSASCG